MVLASVPNTTAPYRSQEIERTRLLLTKEAANLLRVTPNRLYDLAKRGIVPCVHIGRQVRFHEKLLLDWIVRGGSSLPDQ
jgi:excisionase family DNA binding protein